MYCYIVFRCTTKLFVFSCFHIILTVFCNSRLVPCFLEKGYVIPKPFYAKPGEDAALVDFPEPRREYCPTFVRREVYPNRTLPARFGFGKYVMTYSFWYKVDGQLERKIQRKVEFTVAACECRPSRTVYAEVENNEMEAVVHWTIPKPSCPHEPYQKDTVVYRRLSVGKHVITYKYHAPRFWPKLEMECHVNVIVKATFCGTTTYNPATHTCCCGSVYEKNSDYECCGENYYNPSEQICCADSRLRLIEENCSATA